MALELAPDLGESHLAQALYYYHGLRDYYGAERELDRAAKPTLGGQERVFAGLKEITERRFGRWKEAIARRKKGG